MTSAFCPFLPTLGAGLISLAKGRRESLNFSNIPFLSLSSSHNIQSISTSHQDLQMQMTTPDVPLLSALLASSLLSPGPSLVPISPALFIENTRPSAGLLCQHRPIITAHHPCPAGNCSASRGPSLC